MKVTRTFTINQSGAAIPESYYVIVDEVEINVSTILNGYVPQVIVNSNTSWAISINDNISGTGDTPTWLSIFGNVQHTGDGYFGLSIDNNTTASVRTAYIFVRSTDGLISNTIILSQAANTAGTIGLKTSISDEYVMRVTVTLGPNQASDPESDKMFWLNSNTSWTVSIPVSWLHIENLDSDTITSGASGINQLVVQADTNADLFSRSTTITFSTTDGVTATMYIKQNGIVTPIYP